MERRTGIAVCACALAVAAVGLWTVGGFAVVSESVYPLERSASWFQRNITCRLRTLWRRQSYAAENQRLRRENDILRMALQETERGAAAGVRAAVPDGLKAWIPAPVLSRGGMAGSRNFLRIGKGSLHGVKSGAAVAVPDGLVGVVSEVSMHTCVIRLISDPDVKVSCEVESANPDVGAVYGIVSGGGATVATQSDVAVLYVVNPLRAGRIKNGFVPPPRARVTTSGLGGVFPKGLLIGYLVSGTRRGESNLECEGEIEPAVDFPALEEVFIRNEN